MAGLFGACGSSAQSNPHKDAAADLQKDTVTVPAVDAADAKDGLDAQPASIVDASVDQQSLAIEAGRADGPLDVPEKPADATADATTDATTNDSAQDAPGAVKDTGGFETPGPAVLDGPVVDVPVALDVTGVDVAGQGSAVDAATAEAGGEVSAPFSCNGLGPMASDVSQRLCFDFSSPSDVGSFTPEAGAWSAVDGAYQAIGPDDGQITCPGGMFSGSGMTASVVTALSAADVRVHARMTSWTRPDKVLVLRSRPSGNRIEINFRSYYSSGGSLRAGDVVISALFDCYDVNFVATGILNVPQYPYQPIDVDVQLRGQRLTIVVDGKQIYDDTPSATDLDGGTWQLPSQPGSVGFGVFADGQDVFDDVVVEVLK